MRRVLLVVLLVVSLVLVTLYAREGEDGPIHSVQDVISDLAAPFKFIGAAASSGVDAAGEAVTNLTADESTLSGLRAQNAELRDLLAQADEYRQEAERLRELLDMKESYDIDGIAARVVGRSIEAWNQTVTIDVGEADGVETSMTIMGPSGVVGQVVKTSDHTSEVRLLTDPQSGAAALIQSNRGEGIVRGSLEGLLYLENVDEADMPTEGDVIVTSGLGGSYTRGLIIGRVVRVERSQGSATGRIVVAPNDEVSSLEEVLVVKGLNSEGALDSSFSAPDGQDTDTSTEDDGVENGGEGA